MQTKAYCQRGFSLVEMMVALVIGVVLVSGTLAVHVQSNDAHTFADRMARIQENGRFALDVVSPDLRLSGFWGRVEKPASIARRTGDATNPMPPGLAPTNDCYAGFYTNVTRRVEAANEDQTGVDNPVPGCLADANRLDGTDVLVVRHASVAVTAPADLVASRLYVITNAVSGELFVAGAMPIPPGYSAADEIREVHTHLYYVSPNSSAGAGIPALNRLELRDGPELLNQELITGVEDFQVQLGVDSDTDDSVNIYVSPGDPALAGASIIATRAWMRVRGEQIDLGFTDDATYDYADLSVTPADNFRRMLISKTLRFRNGTS